MKTSIKLLAILLFIMPIKGYAQSESDTTQEEIKTGWTFGALPVVAYDTDRGLKYGGLVNFYNYGDGSTYPEYLQSIYLEVSRTTKGSGINQLLFDTERFTKKIPVHVTIDLSYFTENSNDFYGFNGYGSTFHRDFADEESGDYISRMFYRYERKLFHFLINVQDEIKNTPFKWLVGLEHFNHKLAPFDFTNFNEGLDEENKLKDTLTLYDLYTDWSFIPEEDEDGGVVNYIKTGLIYDTRDQKANPMKGMWSEVLFAGAPSFFGNKENSYLKMSLIHRHYFTLIPENLNLAVRLGYQGTILGEAPFYMQTYLLSSFTQSVNVEGLGGAKSLRGIQRNRIMGDDILYGNFELRWKFLYTKIFNQNLYLAFSTFFDTGRVTDHIDLNREKVPNAFDKSNFFDQQYDSFHSSAGAGLRFAMNRNFIVAIDYGRTLDKRDGISGLYIGMNFLY